MLICSYTNNDIALTNFRICIDTQLTNERRELPFKTIAKGVYQGSRDPCCKVVADVFLFHLTYNISNYSCYLFCMMTYDPNQSPYSIANKRLMTIVAFSIFTSSWLSELEIFILFFEVVLWRFSTLVFCCLV